ncbi:cyclin-dependent kinase F-4-like [Wolffia australiana]
MDRYKLVKQVGDGTFGTVWRAVNKLTGEIVAIKKMKKKYYSWQACVSLREVKSLRKMNHPNVVKLKEVIREHDILFLVFEYMDCNLYQLMKDREKPFSEDEVRNWSFQIFHALAHMHQRGYFHRDLKPENLLVTKDTIKVADFGLVRELCSEPPFTEYVSTRWYRAPEVLLQSRSYNFAVDMWAMGTIMAELLTLIPLFPGSSEADQLHKICTVIGSPSLSSWAEGLELASAARYHFPEFPGVPLSTLIPFASEEAVSLITLLCSWDPTRRPSASAALQHPFFLGCIWAPAMAEAQRSTPSAGRKSPLLAKASRRFSTGALPSPKNVSSASSPGSRGKVNSPVVWRGCKGGQASKPVRGRPGEIDGSGKRGGNADDAAGESEPLDGNRVSLTTKLAQMTVSGGKTVGCPAGLVNNRAPSVR